MVRAWFLVVLVLQAAAGAQEARLRVVGSVQDGGLPHAACSCARCEAARADPARERYVASLALIVGDEGEERVFLVDATPDLPEQIDLLRDVRHAPAGQVDREPVDGVLLTHAHIGHYTGLMFLGFEAVNTAHVPVWCTERMGTFLRENGPWGQLVTKGNIDVRQIEAGTPFDVGGVEVEAVRVPHRDEYSDTVAFIFRADRTVMYMPDTEPWDRWVDAIGAALEEVLDREGVEELIVDGCFYSPDELPGRPVSSIGHPLMADTMDRLQKRVDAGSLIVRFTHLNHSNPALDSDGEVMAEIGRRGFSVVREGEEIELRP